MICYDALAASFQRVTGAGEFHRVKNQFRMKVIIIVRVGGDVAGENDLIAVQIETDFSVLTQPIFGDCFSFCRGRYGNGHAMVPLKNGVKMYKRLYNKPLAGEVKKKTPGCPAGSVVTY